MKPYYLDHVVNSQSETNDRRWWVRRRSCRSVVSTRSAFPHEVKVETVATRGRGVSIRVACLLYDILLPMTQAIIRKLNEFLDTHVPFHEECEAVYLMVEVHKLLERERERDHFAKVSFYCDWMVHAKIDRSHTAKYIMEKLNDSFNNRNPSPQESIISFFSLSELRKEMSVLFRTYGLKAKLCQDDNHWKHFIDETTTIWWLRGASFTVFTAISEDTGGEVDFHAWYPLISGSE